ncbi:MAG: hypothetical protein IJ071_11975 [Ruminococcus sp.]|nr:hypothetical protein [Ruminococcus sp.]
MKGIYLRKYAPGKGHFAAAAMFLMALVMLIVGIFRFSRATGATHADDLHYKAPHRSDSILFYPEVLELTRKGTENKTPVCFLNESGWNVYIKVFYPSGQKLYLNETDSGYETVGKEDYQGYICFAAVKEGSAEEQQLLDHTATVRGYFSGRYTDEMKEYLSKIDKYYETEGTELEGIDLDQLPELGVIIINGDREELSFLWALPFLIAGLILLKKAGSPFFYFPDEGDDDKLSETG